MTPSPRDPAQFTRESADRIAAVVRSAELTPPSARPLNFEAVQSQSQSQRKVFRMGSYTGAWARGAVSVVTLDNGSTVSANNRFMHLIDLGARSCAVAKDGTAWHLVQWQWDYTSQDVLVGASLGTAALTFSKRSVVVLGSEPAAAVSVSVTTCSTAAT